MLRLGGRGGGEGGGWVVQDNLVLSTDNVH